MNETINKATGETIKYNRIGGTQENPIYFNDPLPPPTGTPANITGTSLATAPKVNVPTVNTTSPATGIITSTTQGALSDIEQAKLDAEAVQNAVGNKGNEAQQLLSQRAKELFDQRATTTAGQATLEDQAGIAEEQKSLNALNTQIADQNIQLRAEQDRVRSTPMSQSQRAVELNNIEDTYGRRLADLAIRKSASVGNIEAIQSNAERKTKLLLAPIDNQLEYLKTFGQQNVDNLTKKENQTLELLMKNLETKKADTKALEKAKADMIIELANNGGGKSDYIKQINDAQSLTDVYNLGAKSGYVGSLDRTLKQAQISKLSAERAKDVAEAEALKGNLTPTQQKNLNEIWSDFDTQTKPQRTVIDNTKNILTLSEQAKSTNKGGANPSAQIAIVYSYMKSLDPTSTVREGEYATAQNSAGVDTKIRNAYNKTLTGAFLSDSQIDNFVSSAVSLAKEADKQLSNRATEFDRRAEIRGVPKGLVYQSQAPILENLGKEPSPETKALDSLLGGSPATSTNTAITNTLDSLFNKYTK